MLRLKEGHVFYSLKEASRYLRKGWFYISYRGALYPIWWDITKNTDDYVVFVPGRTRREKPLPSFQRRTYNDDLAANVICLSDPSLFFARDLGIAWFVGDKNAHYASGIANLLKVYFGQFPEARVLIYGSSAAGIPAFHIANVIESQCMLYLNNVQTNASRYFPQHYHYMINCAFKNLSVADFESKYFSRINICNVERRFEKMIVTQNLADVFHFNNHFKPFMDADRTLNGSNATYLTYNDVESGHDVLPKNIEIAVIKSILQSGSLNFELPGQGVGE